MSKLKWLNVGLVVLILMSVIPFQSSAQDNEISAEIKWTTQLDGRGLVTWHPTENILAVSGDTHIYIFNGETGEILNEWQSHEFNQVVDLIWHPNGNWLTTVDDFLGNITIWDVNSGDIVNSFAVQNTSSFSWDLTGDYLATASDSITSTDEDKAREISVWHVSSTTAKQEYLLWNNSNSIVVEYSPDGKYLAGILSWYSDPIYVWDAETYELLYSYTESEYHTLGDWHFAQSLTWSPDSQSLAVILNNNQIDEYQVGIWHLETGIYERFSTQTYMHSIAWHPLESWILTAGGDMPIALWDTETFENLFTLDVQTKSSYSVAWSFDGTYFANINYDGTATVWEILPE